MATPLPHESRPASSKGKGRAKAGGPPLPPPPPVLVSSSGKGVSKSGYGSRPPANGTSATNLESIKLKPTRTRVRHRDGTVSEEMRSDVGFESQVVQMEAEVPQYVKDQEAGISRLEPKIFDKSSNRWHGDNLYRERQKASQPDQDENGWLVSKGSLRLVSYNVWFSRKRQHARAAALFSILENLDADIICLQEVTPEFLNWLRDESWIRRNYALSDSVGTTLKGSQLVYGVIMLWKRAFSLASLSLYVLPTRMNRSALVASFRILCHELRVVTVHLESLDNVTIRAGQLERIFQVVWKPSFQRKCLSERKEEHCDDNGDASKDFDLDVSKLYGGAILAGDMNFDQGAEEDQIPVQAGFSDCWHKVKHSCIAADVADGGITMPADDHSGRPTRIDRIFLGPYSGSGAMWKLIPQSMQRLGMESMGDEHAEDPEPSGPLEAEVDRPDSTSADLRPEHDWPYNRPSDHFGLCCDFQVVSVQDAEL